MNKFRYTMMAFAIVAFTVLASSSARAQASRTWVSGVGDDANPCSRTAPCKTFAGAISKTAPGGEIDALDPGGFGALTITKAMTIDGGGGQVASVLVAGTNGIVVQAGTGDTVTLLNLRIQGISGTGNGGINGIRFLQGKALNLLNDYIYNFTTNGIDVALNQTQNATVLVSNSVVKNCAGDGIAITNASTGTVKTSITRSVFMECGNGLHAKNGPNTDVDANNSTFSGNATNGVFADSTSGLAVVGLSNCEISSNGGNGVRAGNAGGGTSAVRIGNNQIEFNVGFGALIGTGGVIETFGNNSIRGNGTNGCNNGSGCTSVAPGS